MKDHEQDPLNYTLGLESSYQPRSMHALRVEKEEKDEENKNLINILVTISTTITSQLALLAPRPNHPGPQPIPTPEHVALFTPTVAQPAGRLAVETAPPLRLEDEDHEMTEPYTPSNQHKRVSSEQLGRETNSPSQLELPPSPTQMELQQRVLEGSRYLTPGLTYLHPSKRPNLNTTGKTFDEEELARHIRDTIVPDNDFLRQTQRDLTSHLENTHAPNQPASRQETNILIKEQMQITEQRLMQTIVHQNKTLTQVTASTQSLLRKHIRARDDLKAARAINKELIDNALKDRERSLQDRTQITHLTSAMHQVIGRLNSLEIQQNARPAIQQDTRNTQPAARQEQEPNQAPQFREPAPRQKPLRRSTPRHRIESETDNDEDLGTVSGHPSNRLNVRGTAFPPAGGPNPTWALVAESAKDKIQQRQPKQTKKYLSREEIKKEKEIIESLKVCKLTQGLKPCTKGQMERYIKDPARPSS